MSDLVLPELTLERDDASAAFFDAAATGELLLQRCADCAGYSPADELICMSCGGRELAPIRVEGRGELVTWTVVHRAPHPAFADVVPYLVGIVELAQGPWLPARLALPAGQARPGLAVRAEFHVSPGGERYPVFVPG